jgi:hypothetical protein
MVQYTTFALANPELGSGIDVADYLWKTASGAVIHDKDLFPKAISLRKSLFNSLDSLPQSGPTLEDAGLLRCELDVNYKQSKYITLELRRKHRMVCNFKPLGNSLFDDMILHTILRPLGQDKREHYINTVRSEAGPFASNIAEAIYKCATPNERESMKDSYYQWRDPQIAKDELIRDLWEVITTEDPVKTIVEQVNLDFGNFNVRKGHLIRAGGDLNSITRQKLDGVLRRKRK